MEQSNETPIFQTALQHQMTKLQDIIKRMAENSRNCKTWCITIIAALATLSSKSFLLPWYVFLIPILPFMYLDMFYLALEVEFRNSYKKLLQDYKANNLTLANVYDMEKTKQSFKVIMQQLGSKSIWPFYLVLMLLVEILGFIQLKGISH